MRGAGALMRGDSDLGEGDREPALRVPWGAVRDMPCAGSLGGIPIPICCGLDSFPTRWVALPCCSTRCESLDRLSTPPRGTPRPAELLRITILLPNKPPFVTGTGPRLTTTVLVPLVGAREAVKPAGGFTITGREYQGIHAPPGCHAHPYPGTNAQLP